ncbi:recombinase family protein [Lichenicoccus sp.]|uniref:recombinase family protein n=1 Tax=Lichenicoccus sp. TaxID=2781899 RepID=UPI003D0C9182
MGLYTGFGRSFHIRPLYLYILVCRPTGKRPRPRLTISPRLDLTRIVTEQIGGAILAKQRTKLAGLLNALQPGNTLAAVRLDLGRNPTDVLTLAHDLTARGVCLRLMDLGAETGTPTGDLVLSILAGVAGWGARHPSAANPERPGGCEASGPALGSTPMLDLYQIAHAAELARRGILSAKLVVGWVVTCPTSSDHG